MAFKKFKLLFSGKVVQSNGGNDNSSFSVKIPNVYWEDIGGLREIKEELYDSIQLPLKFPELFDSGPMRSG